MAPAIPTRANWPNIMIPIPSAAASTIINAITPSITPAVEIKVIIEMKVDLRLAFR